MPDKKFTNCRGIKYRVKDNGEIEFATKSDKKMHDDRIRWCICNDDSEVVGLMETSRDMTAEEVLLSHIEETGDTLHAYRISFLEHEEMRNKMWKSQHDTVADMVGKDKMNPAKIRSLIRPKDMKMIKGERFREAEIRNRQVKHRSSNKWVNSFEIPEIFLDTE